MHTTNSANDNISVSMPENSHILKKWHLYGRLIIVNIPAITCGMMLSWTSPVLPKLNTLGDQNPLGHKVSTTETAIIGSALSFGAIIGPFLGAYLPEKIGRKYTLISLAITFIVGLITLAFARHVYLYYAARLVCGFAYGSVYTVLPIYLVEFAGNSNRGAIINTTAVSTMFGSLLSLCIGPYTSIRDFSLICVLFPAIFIILFMRLIQETPQELLLMGKEEKAKETFFKMNLGSEKDYENIKLATSTKIKAPYSEIFKIKTNVKALSITLTLMTFKQFSGVNVISSYTENIFKEVSGNVPSEIPPIIIECIGLFTTLLVPYLVETNGRKFLLQVSSAGMIIFFTITGVYFYLKEIEDVSHLFWMPLIGLVGTRVSFALGFLTVVWILMTEMMPYNVKAAASALTNSYCWGMLFVVTFAFPIITENAGLAASFWIFAAVNLVAFIFTLIAVLETKGKSMQEIQEMLR